MIEQTFTILIGLIIGLAMLILVLRRPDLGLALTFASLPLYIFTGIQGISFSSLTGVLGGLTLVAYLVNHLTKRSSTNRSWKEILPINKAIYIFAILFFIELLFWDILVPVNVARYYSLTVVQLLVLVWLCNQLIKDKNQLETLMKIFIIVNMIVLGFYLPNFDYFAPDAELERMAGFAGNANEFSIYLGVCLVFMFYFYEKTSSKLLKALLLVLALFTLIPIFLSGSRGGFLFLVIALGYQIIRARKASLLIITIIFLFILIESPLIPRTYIDRMLNIPTDILTQSDTIGMRFDIWRHAFDLWESSPVVGIGTGMFRIRSVGGAIYSGSRMVVAHNSYVSILVENGVIGLFFFLMVNFLSLLNFEKVIRLPKTLDPQVNKLAIAWQSVLLIYILNGLKGNYQYGKILWLAFGISMIFANWAIKNVTMNGANSSLGPTESKKWRKRIY